MPSPERKRVLLIGVLPPTIGGVSIHMQRLAEYVSRNGFVVNACDLYTNDMSEAAPSNNLTVFSGKGVRGKLRLLSALRHKADIAHIHLSTGRNVFSVCLLLLYASFFCRTFITIHSGSFPDELNSMRRIRRAALINSFKRCNKVICVSNTIADAAKNHGLPQAKIRVIPAFIPPSNNAQPAIADSSQGENPTQVVKVCCAGFAIPLYGWETLLDSIAQLDQGFEFHMAFYNEFDQPFFDNLLIRIEQLPNVTAHLNLNPAEFSTLMASCHLFVRPTTTDGDSIAVREALFLGKRVIASNAVWRPEGCFLFETGDPIDLAIKIRAVGHEIFQQKDRIRPNLQVDTIQAGKEIVSVYSERS
jgi:glycosyltransferase involved in cell wall biosynthesis